MNAGSIVNGLLKIITPNQDNQDKISKDKQRRSKRRLAKSLEVILLLCLNDCSMIWLYGCVVAWNLSTVDRFPDDGNTRDKFFG